MCRVLTTIMANTRIQIVWMRCSVLQKGWRCHTETHEREGHFVIQLYTLAFMEYESETWRNDKHTTTLFCSDGFWWLCWSSAHFWNASPHAISVLTGGFKNLILYSVIQKDGLNFVRLYFLNYTWYVNDLYNTWKRKS